jgi:hypothetical protein
MLLLGWSLGEENEQLGIEDSRTTHLTAINQHQNMKIHNKLMKKHTPPPYPPPTPQIFKNKK